METKSAEEESYEKERERDSGVCEKQKIDQFCVQF